MRALLYIAGIAGALTILCIFTVDDPFARWIATRETYPLFWDELIGRMDYLTLTNPYKWTGVDLFVAGSLATLFIPQLRRYAHIWLIMTLTYLLCRNTSFWVKTLTGRLRPSEWLERGGHQWLRDGGYSFPSGHVLLFAALTFPIALAYPRARPVLVFVVIAATCRVAVNAHFLSDVFGAVAAMAGATWLSAQAVRRALPSQILPAYLQ